MQIPLEIAFNNLEPSEGLRARVEDEAAKLERFYPRLTHCRVVVEAPHRHQHKGKLYAVRIHLSLPGQADIEVNRAPGAKQSHQDAYVAIRDAFQAARRQLQDLARQRQGKAKTHDAPPHGRVVRLFAD